MTKLLPVSVREVNQEISCSITSGESRKKIALVVFVGGLTFTELAAIRQLKYLKECGYDVVVLTTNLTNGNKILKEIADDLPQIPISNE